MMLVYDVSRREYPKTNILHWSTFSGDHKVSAHPQVHQQELVSF